MKNDEYDYDKFLEDSGDDYPKYEDNIKPKRDIPGEMVEDLSKLHHGKMEKNTSEDGYSTIEGIIRQNQDLPIDKGEEFYPYAASNPEGHVCPKGARGLAGEPGIVPDKHPAKDPEALVIGQDADNWWYADNYAGGCDKLSEEKKDALIEEVNRQFPTGAQRDDGENKNRHSLIPHEALNRVMERFRTGAEKYGENNWTKGMPLSVYYDSAMRHMQAWWSGDENEDHMAAAVWNMLCAMWTEDNADIILAHEGEFLDDRHKFPRR